MKQINRVPDESLVNKEVEIKLTLGELAVFYAMTGNSNDSQTMIKISNIDLPRYVYDELKNTKVNNRLYNDIRKILQENNLVAKD